MDYETFMQNDRRGRGRIFSECPAETRACLMRTHMVRWLRINRHRLTEEQVVLMEENIGLITPALYEEADRNGDAAETALPIKRNRRVFAPEDWVTAFTLLHSPALPDVDPTP